MGARVLFRSASGLAGEIASLQPDTATIAFSDGLKLTFDNYWQSTRKKARKRGWGTVDKLVARKPLPEPEKALYRMAMLAPAGGAWDFVFALGWTIGVWVGGEVPCELTYYGIKPVEGERWNAELLEMKLVASPRSDSLELAAEAFKRLYRLMTSRLELVLVEDGREARYVF